MALKIAVIKESAEFEKRVAVSSETVQKLVAMGILVMIEKNAGEGAQISDQAFKDAGGLIAKGKADLYKNADIVLCVQMPPEDVLSKISEGALLIGMLKPYSENKAIKHLIESKINGFAMELMPRISRAQSMDVLSSQSNLAGYRAVLDAAAHYSSAFPMMMTAAGTIPPAKVFVMGAGVAGLQAIATARRLGSVVSASDVRPAAKEQVESLGASFVAVENDEFKDAESAGGYAKEMSKDYQKAQAQLVAAHIAKQDIVITTALIPGRPAPQLISEAMLKSMKAGSVLVDLAIENGGNIAGAKLGEIALAHDLAIIGYGNMPSRIARDSSMLYAKNIFNLLKLIIDSEDITLGVDWDDEIIQGIALTRDGVAVHPILANSKPAKPLKINDKKED